MASRVFMVRPAAFGPNVQTAQSNVFQSLDTPPIDLAERARSEFDALVEKLQGAGVHVEVFNEPRESTNPDAVFPNNWVSFHKEAGFVFLYPMLAPTRRDERRIDWVRDLTSEWPSCQIKDLSPAEVSGTYLEGTGSLVFDHTNNRAFMAHSVRSNENLAQQVAKQLDMELSTFEANDANGKDIYHTNVIMGIGQRMAMGCWDAIQNEQKRQRLITDLNAKDRFVLQLSLPQMEAFAGNWIELQGSSSDLFVASATAWNTLKVEQQEQIESIYSKVIADVPNIERFGGGSVRCMICTVDHG